MKHFAKRTRDHANITHRSQGEAERANELLLLARSGDIEDLVQQPRIELAPGTFYTADFRYRDETSGLVFEDYKGSLESERFRMIRNLWPYLGESRLRISYRYGRMRDVWALPDLQRLEQLAAFFLERRRVLS